MTGRLTDWLLGGTGGLLLALMIYCNGQMARHTTPLFASWVAHGTGAAAALLLVALALCVWRGTSAVKAVEPARRPLWVYLGGIPGTLTVILAAITVNGSLALSGTVALMLVGQVCFGILADCFGFFATPIRSVQGVDFLVAFCVLTGSALIIFCGE